MRVSDVNINDDYITVSDTDSVLSISKKLTEQEIPDAIVLNEENKVLGALDDYDIVSKVVAQEKDPKELTATDIMFSPPSVKLDADLEKVEEIIHQYEATILPVVDDENNLLGVITLMDVLEGLAKENEPSGGIFSFLRGLF